MWQSHDYGCYQRKHVIERNEGEEICIVIIFQLVNDTLPLYLKEDKLILVVPHEPTNNSLNMHIIEISTGQIDNAQYS